MSDDFDIVIEDTFNRPRLGYPHHTAQNLLPDF